MVSAVDVDVSVVGITTGTAVFPYFQSSQAKYAAGDQVGFLFLWIEVGVVFFGFAPAKDGSGWGMGPDFICKCMQSDRGTKGIFDTTWRIF